MKEVVVYFGRGEVEAETAAGALRASRLHPRVARDDMDGMLGIGGRLSIGRFIVLVPDREERAARAILGTPEREEPEDRPLLRFVLIAGVITALLLGAALLARSAMNP